MSKDLAHAMMTIHNKLVTKVSKLSVYLAKCQLILNFEPTIQVLERPEEWHH